MRIRESASAMLHNDEALLGRDAREVAPRAHREVCRCANPESDAPMRARVEALAVLKSCGAPRGLPGEQQRRETAQQTGQAPEDQTGNAELPPLDDRGYLAGDIAAVHTAANGRNAENNRNIHWWPRRGGALHGCAGPQWRTKRAISKRGSHGASSTTATPSHHLDHDAERSTFTLTEEVDGTHEAAPPSLSGRTPYAEHEHRARRNGTPPESHIWAVRALITQWNGEAARHDEKPLRADGAERRRRRRAHTGKALTRKQCKQHWEEVALECTPQWLHPLHVSTGLVGTMQRESTPAWRRLYRMARIATPYDLNEQESAMRYAQELQRLWSVGQTTHGGGRAQHGGRIVGP